METTELNKGIAAVLVAGIAFFLAGWVGDRLVREKPLATSAITVAGVATAGPAKAAPAPVVLPPIAPLLAKADPAAGEAFAKKICVACHTFDQGGRAGVGPNLYGVVNAPHAHMQGFNYTAGLKAKQGPWTYADLNEWLAKPSAYVPGTRMIFPGIPDPQLRANVIAWLRSLSPNPAPLPTP